MLIKEKSWLKSLGRITLSVRGLSGEIVGALRARLQWLRHVALSCRQVGAHLRHRGPVVSRQQQESQDLQHLHANWATSYSYYISYVYLYLCYKFNND